MSVLRSIDKVLAAFGNIKAMERTHDDTFTENLISEIKAEKIAESSFGQIYASFQNLADYEFLNITVLSATNIKTFKGSSLVFKADNKKDIIILSDTQEIESDYSNVSKRWLTKISFIVEPEEKKMIEAKKFDKVLLNFKKKTLPLIKCH